MKATNQVNLDTDSIKTAVDQNAEVLDTMMADNITPKQKKFFTKRTVLSTLGGLAAIAAGVGAYVFLAGGSTAE